MKYSEETLLAAIEFVEGLTAYGGTELLPPMKRIYASNMVEMHKRQLVILTDGEVGNVRDIVKLVRSHSKDTRVFTVGTFLQNY